MTDCYKARVTPVIFSVSKSSGSINGGQEVLIKGYGFEHGTVDVKIDGVTCVEKSKTNEEVKCLSGKTGAISDQTEGKVFGGQNGLKRTLYYTGHRKSHVPYTEAKIASDKIKPTNTTLITAFNTPAKVGDWYSQSTEGWFIPPKTGKYRFYQTCDNYCEFFLDTTTPDVLTPANQKMIILNQQWSSNGDYYRGLYLPKTSRDYDYFFKHYRPHETRDTDPIPAYMSSWVDLTAGKKYYMRQFHREWNGDDHASVAVEIQ